MTRENLVNIVLAVLLLAAPLAANAFGEPFYVTLATRIAILALAATGLNLALGLGGLVSFGHAAFFGIGGYAAGILAAHAFSGDPLFFGLPGTNRSEEHTSELQSLMRISYAVFCLKKKKKTTTPTHILDNI